MLQHGVADLSLRPLAERVGTSARLLIYHFDTKEQLVAAALAEVRRRIGASLYQRASVSRPATLRDLIMNVWEWATEAPNQRYFRLLFEVDGLAMFNRLSFSQQVRRANSDVWISLIEGAAIRLAQGGDAFSANSTLIIGAITGLLQEFLSTGDLPRTTQALSALVELIAPSTAATGTTESQMS